MYACANCLLHTVLFLLEELKNSAKKFKKKRGVCVWLLLILISKVFWAEVAAIFLITAATIIIITMNWDFGNEGRTRIWIHQKPYWQTVTSPLHSLVPVTDMSWENTQVLPVIYFANNISVCMAGTLEIYILLDTAEQSKWLPCQKV